MRDTEICKRYGAKRRICFLIFVGSNLAELLLENHGIHLRIIQNNTSISNTLGNREDARYFIKHVFLFGKKNKNLGRANYTWLFYAYNINFLDIYSCL